MEWCDVEPVYFARRMEDARDRARERIEDAARLAPRIRMTKPAEVVYITLEAACAELGIGPAMLKRLCGAGRVPGARRSGVGKGRPWKIPWVMGADGKRRVTVVPGKRGPAARYAAREPIPL